MRRGLVVVVMAMVFAAGFGTVWALRADARSATLPSFHLSGSTSSLTSGDCSRLDFPIYGGFTSAAGAGNFQGSVEISYSGGSASYTVSWSGTTNGTAVGGWFSGSGSGSCTTGSGYSLTVSGGGSGPEMVGSETGPSTANWSLSLNGYGNSIPLSMSADI